MNGTDIEPPKAGSGLHELFFSGLHAASWAYATEDDKAIALAMHEYLICVRLTDR